MVVRLGALAPLSDASMPTGRRMVDAFQMAVQQTNDSGGLLGRRVELLTSDEACDPKTAVDSANELVSRDVTVAIGGGCSAAMVPVLRVFRNAGIPVVIATANSTDLLAPHYDSVFLLSGTTKVEAEHAVAALRRLDGRRLAVVDDGTTFPQAIARDTVELLDRSAPEVTLVDQLTLTQGAAEHPRTVAAITQRKADMVFFTGYYADAARLIRDLRKAGYSGDVLLSDGGSDPAILTVLRPADGEGVLVLSLPTPQFVPGAAAWAAEFEAVYGQYPGPYTMQAYDAARLALNAIRRAGTLDRTAVRWALAGTKPTDIDLLSGPAEFKPDGTQAKPVFLLLRIHNGAFELVQGRR